MIASAPLLSVHQLCTQFRSSGTIARIVDHVSFDLTRGRTLGIVGESGSGKTTLARTILRLIPSSGGAVRLDGTDVLRADRSTLRTLRRRMQIVFQDPVGSLNPRLTVELIIGEALLVHGLVKTRSERRERVSALLSQVGLSPDAMSRYAHQFSGGQRQRIGIARALAVEPDLLILDEPVSALDVSIQAQVLNLLSELRDQRGLTYLFIAHNLSVVRSFCDEVAVMFRGRIAEHRPTSALFDSPEHEYTRRLLSAIPQLPAIPPEANQSTSGTSDNRPRRDSYP